MPHPSRRPLPADAPRTVSILGATGSIGASALRVIAQHSGRYHIGALTAQNNAEKLIALAMEFRPALVAIGNEAHFSSVRSALTPLGIRVLAGAAGVEEAASAPADLSIAAIVGAAGLLPTLRAVEQGTSVALANKEALVCAGELVMQLCATHGTQLLPIDSEHNAIFQVLASAHRPEVEKITLTASGGPLLDHPLNRFAEVTPEIAVNHPRWSMGAKISVDSATMMNKGLELIEAHYLFAMPASRIAVLIHPESIVHSLVHYSDGSVLAQLGMPDMAIPIAYALSWPERMRVATPRLNLEQIGALHFSAVEAARFPALALAREALTQGPAHLIALNAANEIAVAQFLTRRIGFTAIASTVARIVEATPSAAITCIDDVVQADSEARTRTEELIACTR
ncbi:MAG: 1-deoxy-D-xylulose-5-phosphate reductoisomerase [Alphaproteobacteria bacterium]|nr:1-deoxy-D-xylulose-5-phosphate reductoisomerase [Alphaproteobacteria bacterium]